MRRKGKGCLIVIAAFAGLLAVLWFLFLSVVTISPPEVDDGRLIVPERTELATNYYKAGYCYLRKNEFGLWEMTSVGEPLETGLALGALLKDLLYFQETVFIEKLREIVPSDIYINFLKYFAAWFNRDIDKYIPEEYLLEIYGISRSAPDEYRFVGEAYQRMLNYHAAHDIGHAVQGMNLTAEFCTSFAVWGENSDDGTIIIGRNFDFYSGADFAENKIVHFHKPSKGYKFAMVTWAGMVGAVSGMNEKGLTVTINSAQSKVPTNTGIPITLLCREILQNSANIREAVDIARKHQIFVSETILIGSAEDNRAAIIEKTPDTLDVFYPGQNYVICANHFQSPDLRNTASNLENIASSHSLPRYDRAAELLADYEKITPTVAENILRNIYGAEGNNIGLGNEKALNIIVGHHSVIFKPTQRLMWISASPFNQGDMICYDLNRIFDTFPNKIEPPLFDSSRTIASTAYTYYDWEQFRDYYNLRNELKRIINLGKDERFEPEKAERLVSLNPEYFEAYVVAADYFAKFGKNEQAVEFYNKALKKDVSSTKAIRAIDKKINELNK